jgi:hypothetical protein
MDCRCPSVGSRSARDRSEILTIEDLSALSGVDPSSHGAVPPAKRHDHHHHVFPAALSSITIGYAVRPRLRGFQRSPYGSTGSVLLEVGSPTTNWALWMTSPISVSDIS